MSNYGQSPYQPPYQPPVNPQAMFGYRAENLSPARRAGLFIWALALVMLILSGCFGLIATVFPKLREMPEMQQALQKADPSLLPNLRLVMGILAGFCAALMILYVMIGAFVRRGSRPAIFTGIVVTGLVTAYLAFNAMGALLTPGGIAGACVCCIGFVLHVAAIVFLVKALRTSPRAAMWQQQQMQSYWQAMQAQAQSQAPGYGYGYGQPPAPPESPQPPPDSSSPGGST